MIAPNRVYKSRSTDNPLNSEDRYGFKRCLAVVKATVPVIDVADLLCGPGGLRRVNTHWVGHCTLPDHEDKTPSFVVCPANNSWWCFGCSRGSDVLDLYQFAHGYSEKWEALVGLAREWGVELPRRPERWHQWQSEKDRARAAMLDSLTRSYQRRFFRVFGDVVLEGIEDETEREEEARKLFEDLHKVARIAARNRMDRNA